MPPWAAKCPNFATGRKRVFNFFPCVENVFVSVTWTPLRAIEGGVRGGGVTSDDSAATYVTVGGPGGRPSVKILPQKWPKTRDFLF